MVERKDHREDLQIKRTGQTVCTQMVCILTLALLSKELDHWPTAVCLLEESSKIKSRNNVFLTEGSLKSFVLNGFSRIVKILHERRSFESIELSQFTIRKINKTRRERDGFDRSADCHWCMREKWIALNANFEASSLFGWSVARW